MQADVVADAAPAALARAFALALHMLSAQAAPAESFPVPSPMLASLAVVQLSLILLAAPLAVRTGGPRSMMARLGPEVVQRPQVLSSWGASSAMMPSAATACVLLPWSVLTGLKLLLW